MGVVHKDEAEFWQLLTEVFEAAGAVIEESECWVTNDHIGCGQCRWCVLAEMFDRAREAKDS